MTENRPHNYIHDYKTLDDVLTRGGVVIVPTETVYGLAARPDNKAAIDKIYTLKGRDFNKPLALCVSHENHYKDLAEWSPLAQALTRAFWPGPLTLVIPAKTPLTLDKRVYSQDLKGNPTIALRCAQTNWSLHCQTMPLALTSANRSGDTDAVSFDVAYDIFGQGVDGAFRDINACQGTPSTILALNGRSAKVLRRGAMTPADFAPFDIDWQV